jgi:hypothetical protein
MDPLSVLAVATTAYNALKSGIEAGKELQGMAADLSSLWQSAAQLTRMAAEPPKKTFFVTQKDAEARAIEIYIARQKAMELTLEAKRLFIAEYGLGAWDSVQKEVVRIKKEAERMRIEEEKAAQQRLEDLKEATVITSIVLGLCAFIGLVGFVLMARG